MAGWFLGGSEVTLMEKMLVRCLKCGKKLFFLLPKGPVKGGPTIEIQCEKDRCKAINIINFQDPDKIVISLKED